MPLKRPAFLIAIFCCQFLCAQSFDFNQNCRSAYNHILALKLKEGTTELNALKTTQANNLIPYYLENYVDFLNIYTADNPELYEQLKKNKEIRLNKLAKGDQSSPYYLFTQAEIYLQWAALNIKFGDYLSAIFSIRKAYKHLEQNEKKFPDFKPDKKSLGVLYALLGSVPDKYKWGVNLLGMDGNVEQGMHMLSDLVEYGNKNDFIYQEETVTYYAFLLLHLQNDAETAWKCLLKNGFPKKDNLMNVFTCAHLGVYGKHNEEAFKLLQTRPASTDTFPPFPFLDYLYGLAKLGRLDSDADFFFKKFIAAYKGTNHIKSAYQKIAWCYLLKGDSANYFYFISKIEKYGATNLDADKQAKKEAENKRKPNVNLLRARVLFDGGYYARAAKELNNISFPLIEEHAEYLYRMGRIYDECAKRDSALVYYDKAIDTGRNLPRYFAANSALECGKIYEAQNDKEKARYYYNLCISLPNKEYKDGIDQKAKAGLNRLR